MKKTLCIFIALVLSLSLAVPAYAANTFVPSITYKDGPDIETAVMNGERVEECLEVTTISDARNKTTDITQPERDLLLELYEKLYGGDMKLPIANDRYVIRELVDVSFAAADCAQPHQHESWLSQPGNKVTVEFDLGVKSSADVLVLVYLNGQWTPAESVKNKGYGIVSVVFEDIGPTAFCVDTTTQTNPPQTGDNGGSQLLFWSGILAGSTAALLVLVFVLKRLKDEEDED